MKRLPWATFAALCFGAGMILVDYIERTPGTQAWAAFAGGLCIGGAVRFTVLSARQK